jgi:hypothetical protein
VSIRVALPLELDDRIILIEPVRRSVGVFALRASRRSSPTGRPPRPGRSSRRCIVGKAPLDDDAQSPFPAGVARRIGRPQIRRGIKGPGGPDPSGPPGQPGKWGRSSLTEQGRVFPSQA